MFEVLAGAGYVMSLKIQFLVSLLSMLFMIFFVWVPVYKAKPECWLDGEFQRDDIYFLIKILIAATVCVSPFAVFLL